MRSTQIVHRLLFAFLAVGLFALAAGTLPVPSAEAQTPARDSSFDTRWRFAREAVTGGVAVNAWRWAPANPKQIDDSYGDVYIRSGPPVPSDSIWRTYALGSDAPGGKGGFTWFQTTLPATPGPDRVGQITFLSLNAPSMTVVDAQLLKGIRQADDNWLVLLNGNLVSRQSGNSGQFTFDLNGAWHDGGPNVLTVLVDNVTAIQGGLSAARIADRPVPAEMNTGFDDHAWETVVLPHTPKIETYLQYFPWQGLCWYRKTFTPPSSWRGRRVSVEFQGVMQVAEVWVNGRPRLTHYGAEPLFSGVVTIDRMPKFAYYFYQSWRSPTLHTPLLHTPFYAAGPMLSIASYWKSNSPKDVTVFSNCDKVELFVSGVSAGTKSPDSNDRATAVPHPPFTFPGVPFAPGTLKAVRYLAGKAVAAAIVRTPDKPFALKLSAEELGRPLTADGADVVFVRAAGVDSAGTLVPDAAVSVRFSAFGPGTIVGDNPRITGTGISSCLLRAGLTPGPITITATADGLTSVKLVVRSMKPNPALQAWR